MPRLLIVACPIYEVNIYLKGSVVQDRRVEVPIRVGALIKEIGSDVFIVFFVVFAIDSGIGVMEPLCAFGGFYECACEFLALLW